MHLAKSRLVVLETWLRMPRAAPQSGASSLSESRVYALSFHDTECNAVGMLVAPSRADGSSEVSRRLNFWIAFEERRKVDHSFPLEGNE